MNGDTHAALFNVSNVTGTSSIAEIPSFPPPLRHTYPNPDGSPDFLKTIGPYAVKYLEEMQARQIMVEHDLIYQFAVLVAGNVRVAVGKYVEGGSASSSMLKMMIANVATVAIQSKLPLPERPLTREEILQNARSLREIVRNVIPTLQTQSLLQGLGTAQRAPPSEASQKQLEDLRRAAVDRLRGSQLQTAPVFPRTVPTRAAAAEPQPNDPAQMFMPPPTYRVLSAEEAQRRASAPKEDESPMDERFLLAYLLFRGNANQTELNLVDRLTNRDSGHMTPEQLQQIISSAQKVEQLLNRSAISPDMASAPTHTGHIFFTPEFSANVDRATDIVRMHSGITGVLQIDLMTHEAVRHKFAFLVANLIKTSAAGQLSRYGGGGNSAEARANAIEYRCLVDQFTMLTQVYRDKPFPGRYLTFTNCPDTVLSDQRLQAGRAEFARAHGVYFSDASQRYPDRSY